MESRVERQNAVWGAIILVLGVLLLVDWIWELSPWAWVVAAGLLGFIPFVIFLRDTSDWLWLIPTYVLWAIALLVALSELDALGDTWVAVFVLLSIALPFLVTYLRRPARWWPLIPAYTLAAIALMLPLEEARILNDELVASYVLFAITLAFLYVYLRNRRNWWALIPAGILGAVGLGLLIAGGAGQFILAFVLVAIGAWVLARGLRGRGQPEQIAPPGGEEREGPPQE